MKTDEIKEMIVEAKKQIMMFDRVSMDMGKLLIQTVEEMLIAESDQQKRIETEVLFRETSQDITKSSIESIKKLELENNELKSDQRKRIEELEKDNENLKIYNHNQHKVMVQWGNKIQELEGERQNTLAENRDLDVENNELKSEPSSIKEGLKGLKVRYFYSADVMPYCLKADIDKLIDNNSVTLTFRLSQKRRW